MPKDTDTFRYRVGHWSHYHRALLARDGPTFWLDEAALTTRRNSRARPGADASRITSDTAIHCAVIVKRMYRLSLRAAQGFVSWVMSLMRLDLPVPNASTVCRRHGALTIPIAQSPISRPHHIVIDATGLRVYGPREWHSQKRPFPLDVPLGQIHQQGRYAWGVASGCIQQSLAKLGKPWQSLANLGKAWQRLAENEESRLVLELCNNASLV